jgi:uncharacterized membrane protein YdcZ (DUF606 family)
MIAVIVCSYVIGAVALIDQMRRTPSEWAAADRNRAWWTWMTGMLTLVACGVVAGLAYLFGVVPRFGHDDGVDNSFRKVR